jgi:hypothetical protein
VKPAFCAHCTEARSDLVNRDGYWLCPSCDPESDAAPRPHRLGPERGYEVPDTRAPIGAIVTAFAHSTNRVAGPMTVKFTDRRGGMVEPSRPGFVTVRVPRMRPDGTPIDAKEARATLSDEPWFAELQHRGTTNRYHLFDRPDIVAARDIRSRTNIDVTKALQDLAKGARK